VAAKKVRVYELAREFHVENAVILELCLELKLAVKSHSSSLNEPLADLVRAVVKDRGLEGEPEPEPEPIPEPPKVEEPKKVVEVSETPAKPSKSVSSTKTPAPPSPDKTAKLEVKAPELDKVFDPSAKTASPQTPPPPKGVGAKKVQSKPSAPPPPPPPGKRVEYSDKYAKGGRFKRAPKSQQPSSTTPGDPKGKVSFVAAKPAPNFPPPGNSPFNRGGPGKKKKRKKKKSKSKDELQPMQAAKLTPTNTPVPQGEVVVLRGINAQDLAPELNRTSADLVKFMFEAGEMITATATLSDDMIDLIADELNVEITLVDEEEEKELELLSMVQQIKEDGPEDLKPRAPVVTVMGHVDHGKTTLLDYFRKSNVSASEAGGITQHIGAYQVHHNGKDITFIDTPGHEAFTAMRARGAQATDIAILVCAANDGVKPQTVEALKHAQEAGVQIIVAVTKIDLPDVDTNTARQQLSDYDLLPEEWGGKTLFIDVSAKSGEGMEDLLESILLVAEVEDYRANPTGAARALVLESHMDVGRGPVATVLVRRGELNVGDLVVAGAGWGKVRALVDEYGNNLELAGPGVPVEILGLSDTPKAGDELWEAPNERVARSIANARDRRRRLQAIARSSKISKKIEATDAALETTSGAKLEDIFAAAQRGEITNLNIVLKADAQGSLEALTDSIKKLDVEHPELEIVFVQRSVGGISESDIDLAAISNAVVIGFNVRPDKNARERAEIKNVDIRLHEIIYNVLDEMKAALTGLLAPVMEEIVTGEAEVREVFGVPKIGKIAGCQVRSGVITRGSKVRFLRDGVVIWNGIISSLKRFKDDAKEVKEGFECGIGLENYSDVKPGDIIETFEEKMVSVEA
jgi:translation initiation factor IF-2